MLWGLRVELGTSEGLRWGKSVSLGLTGLLSQALALWLLLACIPRALYGSGLTSISCHLCRRKALEIYSLGLNISLCFLFLFLFSSFSVWETRSQYGAKTNLELWSRG